jgi:1,5-anhydro-D-fructose reductase (1,5-anhydro-D-mannitol-forming)
LKTITWGIIGCGNVTEKKSGPAYQKTAGFTIGAVMRRNADLAADYAKRHHIPKFYTDADALINDPEIDAIYIATPPDSHKYYGIKVALAGKPCCIEKPMATNYLDCMAIFEAFEKRNLPLFIAYYRRSLPRFNQIKAWIDDGSIGVVRQVRWNLSKPVSAIDLSGNYNWRTDKNIAAGGYFDDLASHGIDLFTYLLGNIKTVAGVSSNQLGLYDAKDTIAACWEHESGVTGTGNWNFGAHEREDVVAIYGSSGKIAFSVFDEMPLVLSNTSGKKEMFIENPENIQLHHVDNMRAHLFENKTHPSTGKSGAHTSWVLNQIIA